MSSNAAEPQELSNYKIEEIVSPETFRDMNRLLELKSGDNVKLGCGKTKCPCYGNAENCPAVKNQTAQVKRLNEKEIPIEVKEYFENHFEINYSLPDGMAGAG